MKKFRDELEEALKDLDHIEKLTPECYREKLQEIRDYLHYLLIKLPKEEEKKRTED